MPKRIRPGLAEINPRELAQEDRKFRNLSALWEYNWNDRALAPHEFLKKRPHFRSLPWPYSAWANEDNRGLDLGYLLLKKLLPGFAGRQLLLVNPSLNALTLQVFVMQPDNFYVLAVVANERVKLITLFPHSPKLTDIHV